MGARRTSRRRCERAPAGGDGALEGDKPAKTKFKTCPIGYFHIEVAEVRTEQGKLHMFVAIDRTSKFAFVDLQQPVAAESDNDRLLNREHRRSRFLRTSR